MTSRRSGRAWPFSIAVMRREHREIEGLFAGARRRLRRDGFLYLYGPYTRDGAHTSEGNVEFDASLRTQDPAWGLRDTTDIAALAARTGFALARIVEMPANNLSLFLTPDEDG